MSNSSVIVEAFIARFGRKPTISDIDDQAEICTKTRRHSFNPLNEVCDRCGKAAMEELNVRR